MNKKIKITLIVVGSLITLYSLLNATGLLSGARTRSAANDPGIKLDEHFFYSSLIRPDRFDFICFTGPTPLEDGKKPVIVSRACGLPGDVIEIKNAILFVNGESTDSKLTVKHFYRLAKKDYESVKANIDLDEDDIFVSGSDSLSVTLSNRDLARYHLPAVRITDRIAPIADSLFGPEAAGWDVDNFGPVKIPAGNYFVLGDNRHAAADSRFIGFVPSSALKGTVIGKH